mgnify:CR=1 FL=1
MQYLGVGEVFVLFIGPVIPPLLALFWYLKSKKEPE